LIVVAAVWEAEQLGFEVGKPGRTIGEDDTPTFEQGCLDGEACDLVGFRRYGATLDRMYAKFPLPFLVAGMTIWCPALRLFVWSFPCLHGFDNRVVR
jgi:hypothetical protein